MNDRAVSILEQYDLTVERTWKGRGSILFETGDGTHILKEYKGAPQRIAGIAGTLEKIRRNGYEDMETILPNKEGEFFCTDYDGTIYVVKTYSQAKECNIRDKAEYLRGIRHLARLHNAMEGVWEEEIPAPDKIPVLREFEKHNAELRCVRRYLKGKSQKSDFELYLQKYYDFFFEKALAIRDDLQKEDVASWYGRMLQKRQLCHGDFQYHNILVDRDICFITNFEKISVDSPVRDLYLFMRKLLEKNNWSVDVGNELLKIYNEERKLPKEEVLQLKYRFSYPDKFWKIVNYYFNSSKSWISCKNSEKLEKILEQEEAKNHLIRTMFP